MTIKKVLDEFMGAIVADVGFIPQDEGEKIRAELQVALESDLHDNPDLFLEMWDEENINDMVMGKVDDEGNAEVPHILAERWPALSAYLNSFYE